MIKLYSDQIFKGILLLVVMAFGLPYSSWAEDGNDKEQECGSNGEAAYQGPFADVPADHPAADAIWYFKDNGIIIGYPDGTFRGERTMSRYECAMVFSRIFDSIADELEERGMDIRVTGQEQPGRFDDIEINWVLEHWGGTTLAQQGLLSLKYTDGNFHGDDTADRLDFAVFIGRLWTRIAGKYHEVGIEISTADEGFEFPFEDITEDDYGYDEVRIVVAEGLMPGYPDGCWHPEYPVNKYDFAIILAEFWQRVVDISSGTENEGNVTLTKE